MNRLVLTLLHLANGSVVVTGAVYAVMVYLVRPTEEWAVVNHPWQPHVQHLHVITAPLLVFAAGVVWSRHVEPNLRADGRPNASGLSLLLLLVPMAASGYLLQVAVAPGWRQAWGWVHLLTSLAWVAAFPLHWLQSRRRAPGHPSRSASAGRADA